MRKWWISAALVSLFLPSLEAARFRVTAAGSAITGAEVCLFQAGPVANPVSRFFRATEVSCSPADQDVPVPTGDWNVYARKGSEYISERVELITARVKPVELPVVAAAEIDPSGWPLDKTERLFIYIPRSGSAMPLDTIAPAGAIVPILVKDGRLAEVGEVVIVPAEEMTRLERPAKSAAVVVAPVVVQSLPAGSYQVPEIVVTDASGRPHRNLTPIARVLQDLAALAIFRGVPPGVVTAKLAGSRWKSTEVNLEASVPVAVLETPLIARPSSKLTVHWWTPVDLTALRAPQPECAAKPDWINTIRGADAKEFAAKLLICPDEPNVIAAKCVSSTSHPLATGELRGRVEFEDVPAGAHYVNFSYPGLPEVLKRVDVTREAESVADVELRYVSFYGKVTRGGEPVHARVFGTVTDPETGQYVAVLSRLPAPPVPNSVTFCDGSGVYRFVLDEALEENTEFDIEIPENRLIVEVVEKKTGAPLKGVSVSLGARHPGGPRDAMHYAGPAGKTDAEGRVVIETLLTNRQISVCASHPDYDGACADPFSMKDVREKTVRIELAPVVKRRGRLIGANPKTSELVWFSRDGRLTETVRDFAANGDFIYKKPHVEGEIVIALGADHPLYAFFQPRIQDDEVFQIVFPQARRRTFQVTLSEASREEVTFETVQIGDVVVPINAMGWHQMARGIQGALRPGWTTTIPDVLETGPITIVLVPFSVMKHYQNTRIEMPLIPEYGSLPKLSPGESDSVTFE